MMEQLAMPVAEVLRDVGMARVEARANRAIPGWSELALAVVRAFAVRADGLFTGEDMTTAFYATPGVVAPPSDKAFGPVFKRAIRLGLIEFVDYGGKRAKGHCSPCPRYRSKVYGKLYTEVA